MKFFITYCFLFFIFIQSQAQDALIKGNITNYAGQPLSLFKCYGDTLLLIDSTHTNKNGEFVFFKSPHGDELGASPGMYKIQLQKDQFFFVLYDKQAVEIKTLYEPNVFYNIATDSLVVLSANAAGEVNKQFYEFQRIQQKINVANYFLVQMMRLYPLPDPFHKKIEDEYFSRYKAMEQLIIDLSNVQKKKQPEQSLKMQLMNLSTIVGSNKQNMAAKIALAYYQSVLPDWKQPDPWRDSIIALHFFDYFNPADSFYLQTNILPEKIGLFLTLSTNKKDAYGQAVKDEMLFATAAQEFLEKVKSNKENFDFCLKYLLKGFDKEKQFTALLAIYDRYLKTEESTCEPINTQFDWIRKKATILKNIQIGSIAPDFDIEKGTFKMNQLQSAYTLLLFWATWCPHCVKELPVIKKVTDEFNRKTEPGNLKLITVAVSLDTDSAQWEKFIAENNLLSFLNFSELKGWDGEVSKQYNVYATPTMFLLDKVKKIISIPLNSDELKRQLEEINK